MNFDLSKQLNLLYQEIDRSSSIQFLLNELLHDSESLSLPQILGNLKSLPIQDEASFLSQLQESLQIKDTPILQNVTALGRDSCSEAIRTAVLQKIEEKFTELLPQSSSTRHDSTRGYEALKELEQSLENYLINPNEANKRALEEAVALEKFSLRPQQAEFQPKFLKQEEPSSFASILKSPEFYRASLKQAATEILKIENPNQQKINDRFHSNDDPLSIGSRLTFDNAFRQNPLSADVPLLRPNRKQLSEIQTLKETLGTLDILKFMPLPEHNEVIDRLLEDKLALISKLQDSLSPTTLFDPELIEETNAFIKAFNKEKQKIESSRQELIKTLITEHSQSLTRNISLIDQESAELERLYQQIPDDSKIRTDIDTHIHSLTTFKNLLLADLDNFNRLSPKPPRGIFRTPPPLDIVSLSALFETSTAQLGRLNDSIRSFHTQIEQDLATVQTELLEQNKRQNELITSLQTDHVQISQQLSSKSGDYDRVSSELSRINQQIDSILKTFSSSPTQQSISFSVSDASQALEAINANIKIKEERILHLQSTHALEIETLKEKHTAQLTRLEGTIKEQKGEIQNLLAEINEKELAIEGLNRLQFKNAGELTANTEKIASLKQQLQEAQDQMRTTQDALGSLRGAQEVSSAELIEKSKRIEELERRLLSQDEQVRVLTESNDRLLQTIRDTEQAAAQQIELALEKARGNILQLESKYSTELSAITGLNTGLRDQLEEKQRELSALKVLMAQQGSTLEEKDRLLTTAQTAVREQSKDLKTLQSQITELRENLKSQETKITELEQKNGSLLAQMQRQKDRIVAQLDQLNKISLEGSDLRAQLEQQKNDYSRSIRDLQSGLEALGKEKEALSDRHSRLEDSLATTSKALLSKDDELESMKKLLTENEGINDRLSLELESVKSEAAASIAQLKEEIDTTVQELDRQLEKNGHLGEENSILKEKLRVITSSSERQSETLVETKRNLEGKLLELIDTRDQITQLETQLLAQNEKIEEQGEIIALQKRELEQLRNSVTEKTEELATYHGISEEEKKQLGSTIQLLKTELESKARAITASEKALTTLQETSDLSLQQREQKISELQGLLNISTQDTTRLQAKNDDLSGQLIRMREAHKEQLERQSEEFNRELLRLQTEFRDQLSQAQSINSTLSIDLQAKIASIKKLQTTVSGKDVTLVQQEKRLEDIRQEIDTKNIELTKLRSTLSSLTEQLERQKVSIRGAELVNQNLLERLEFEQKKTAQQLEQLSSISTENTELKRQLDEQYGNIVLIMNELLINQESLRLARNELESKKTVEEKLALAQTMILENEVHFEERIRILSETNRGLSGEINLLKERIAAQTIKIGDLEDTVRQQEEKLGTLTNRIKEQEASIDATVLDNEDLKTKLRTSQEELIASAKLLEQSQKDLQELRSTSSINLTEKNSFIEILDQRIKHQDQAIVLLERKASGFESELADARRKIAEQQRVILSLSSENTEYIRQINQLTAKTFDDASALTTFKEQLTQANTKLHQLSSQKGDIHRELRLIKQQLQTAQNELLSSSAAKSKADDEILRLKRSRAQLISDHELSIQQKELQIENLKRTLSDTEDLSRSENTRLRREIDRLQEGLRTAQSDNDRLMGDYSVLEKELAKRAQIQQSQQLTIDEYFGELQAQEKTIGELEKLNLELARRNKTLEDENAALSEIIRQQEHALNESRQRALQAEEQNTLLRAALSQLQTDLSTQQETIRALQTKLNQTQDDGKSQAAALALQINDLERNIAQKQSQIDDLSRALDQQSTDHTTQIGLLTSEIRGQQTTLEQLTNQIARYKEEQKASAARQDSEIQQKIKLLNKTIGGLEKKLPSPHRYQVEPLLRSAKKIKSSLEQITKNPDIDTLLSNEKKISEIDLKIKELKGRITELFRPKPITTVNPPKSQPDPDFNLTSLLTSLFGSSSRAPVVPPINLLETLADKLTTSSSATRFNFDKNNPLHLIKNDAGDRIQELKIFIKDPAPLSPGSLIQPAHADQFTDYLSVTEKDGAFVTSYNISSQNKTELLNEPTYQDKLNDFYEQQAATLQEAHGLDDRALLTPAKIKFEITSIADALELSSILIALNKAELKIELDLTLSQEVCNTLKQEVTSIQDPVKKDLIEKITAKHPSFINLTKELVEILKHEKSTPGITH